MERPDVNKLVEEITNYVNTMSLKPEEFTDSMSRQHRTLQQSFTRLCLKWIEYCASEEYRYDPRNEAAHDICKQMVETFVRSNDIANVEPSNFLPTI